jgi:hypothetical protein
VGQRVEQRGLAAVRKPDDPDLERHRGVRLVAEDLRAEADLPAWRVPLQVHDTRDDDREPAVERVELHRAARSRAHRALDRVRRLRLDGRGNDLPAVEGELDADGVVSQGTPPP